MKSIRKSLCVLTTVPIAALLWAGTTNSGSLPRSVSLVQLLANPDRYDRAYVAVEGFYHAEFEESSLYLCEEHARHLITQNGIWVGAPARVAHTNGPASLNDTYVRVEGIFKSTPKGAGHMGLWPAELDQITLLVELPKRSPADETPGSRGKQKR